MTTNSKTLVITGSSGFVGQSLAKKAILLGFKVIGIDIKTDVNKSWESHELSITEEDFAYLIPEDSVVIHLASLSTDLACAVNVCKTTKHQIKTLNINKLLFYQSISHFMLTQVATVSFVY